MRTPAQWAAEYSADDQGFSPVWASDRSNPTRWEIDRRFSPLSWGLGIEVLADIGRVREWGSIPHSVSVLVMLGPWSLTIAREWPAA